MKGVPALNTVGGGPWRVLPDCPSLSTHNTLRAAIGSGPAHHKDRKCICPRGQDILALETARRQERSRRREEMRKQGWQSAMLVWLQPLPTERRRPDLSDGLCVTPEGMKIADLGTNDMASLKGIRERQAAKDQCEECPLLQTCRAWVLENELPAGSWGGVWGGLDPWNRRGLELVIRDGKAWAVPYVYA